MEYNAGRAKLLRQALRGPHFASQMAKPLTPEFEVGDLVKAVRLEKPAKVVGKTSWGHYELEGHEGSFFPPTELTLVEKGPSK